jgi:cell division protein FtsB
MEGWMSEIPSIELRRLLLDVEAYKAEAAYLRSENKRLLELIESLQQRVRELEAANRSYAGVGG